MIAPWTRLRTSQSLMVCALGVVFVVLGASPASAHGRGSDATNFTSVITATPEVDGLQWQVLNGDEYLELRNATDTEVLVPGYTGEPYLRIGPEGVFRNLNSAATYLNEDRFGQTAVPPDIGEQSDPEWEHISQGSTYAWHDHRIHWMAQADPPAVAANPGTVQMVNAWTVPVEIDGASLEIAGDLIWVPGQSPLVWLVPALVLLSTPIIIVISRSEPDPDAFTWRELSRAGGIVALVVAAANVVHLIDDLGATPVPLSQSVVSAVQTFTFIAIGVFTAVRAIQSRDGAFTALGVSAGAIFVGQGLLYTSVLGASQTASVFPGWLTRTVIAASLAQVIPLGVAAVFGTRALLAEFDNVPLAAEEQA